MNTKNYNMPFVILKKTFKVRPDGFKFANEKSFTLHGSGISSDMIASINGLLQEVSLVREATQISFAPSGANGHWTATMNHDYQKYNEEDAVCAILDAMEMMGWSFKFQYDQDLSSTKVLSGSSLTSREIFIFHREPVPPEKHTIELSPGALGITLGKDSERSPVSVINIKSDSQLVDEMKIGDFILSLNGEDVTKLSPGALNSRLKALADDTRTLVVSRNVL